MSNFNKLPELLAPAGNYEKMETAFRFGADAVYLAGKKFGMRAAADNFSNEELKKTYELTRKLGKKFYLTLNIYPRENEYPEIERFLSEISSFPPDAVLVSDIGVLNLVKKVMPSCAVHISTQANIVSAEAALAWKELGAERVVLARELSLAEIKEICRRIDGKIGVETFIHGSMCVSYSGRCLLSNNLTGRDGNRGECAQPCRWNYKFTEIEEDKRPGMHIPVEEDDRGTFIMSSKDMNLIGHIPELIECGIDSFKIEGRMKNMYYVAATTYAYRSAIDSYFSDRENYRVKDEWQELLSSVTHREYSTGYFFSDPSKDANLVTVPGYLTERKLISKIIGKEDEYAVCSQKNKISKGDSLSLFSSRYGLYDFRCDEILNESDAEIDSAPTGGMIFKIKPGKDFEVGDLIITK